MEKDKSGPEMENREMEKGKSGAEKAAVCLDCRPWPAPLISQMWIFGKAATVQKSNQEVWTLLTFTLQDLAQLQTAVCQTFSKCVIFNN